MGSSRSSVPPEAVRCHLPDTRDSITHHFTIESIDYDQGGTAVAGPVFDGYITVGHYDNGQPAEIFITMTSCINGNNEESPSNLQMFSLLRGVMDTLAISISISLQYGVPISEFTDKFVDTVFSPEGPTKNREIPYAKSLADYIFRWLAIKYCGAEPHPASKMML